MYVKIRTRFFYRGLCSSTFKLPLVCFIKASEEPVIVSELLMHKHKIKGTPNIIETLYISNYLLRLLILLFNRWKYVIITQTIYIHISGLRA